MTDAALKARLSVEGMDCTSCATKIENALQRIDGVSDVAVSVPAGTVTIIHDGTFGLETFRDRIEKLGYGVSTSAAAGGQATGDRAPPETMERHEGRQPWWKSRKGMLVITSGLSLTAAYLLGKLFPATEHWAFLIAMLIGLVPIGRRAFSAASAGTPFSIEMLMSIAAIGAVMIGATEEAATVVFLFLIGELLEGVAASRARASIQDLTKLVRSWRPLARSSELLPGYSGELGFLIIDPTVFVALSVAWDPYIEPFLLKLVR